MDKKIQEARSKLYQAWREYVYILEEADADVLEAIDEALAAMGNNEMDC